MRDRKPGGPGDLRGGIPFADGAGEVVALGTGVTRFKVGDRVVGIFMPRWIDGDRTAEGLMGSRGGNAGGMLSEFVVADEQSLVTFPRHLSYEEAATLPTSGVTAWVGLFKYGRVKTGDYVLLEGTGGVSTFGLVFAVAAGAKPIITSSSDAKLEHARKLGAFGAVNYRADPEWQKAVRALTGDAGVKQVLEVGGRATLAKALEALAFDGHVAMIGTLSGFAEQLPTGPLFQAGAHCLHRAAYRPPRDRPCARVRAGARRLRAHGTRRLHGEDRSPHPLTEIERLMPQTLSAARAASRAGAVPRRSAALWRPNWLATVSATSRKSRYRRRTGTPARLT